MYRGQRITQMLLEKEQSDYALMNRDYSEWYAIDRSLLPPSISASFYQFSFDNETQTFINQSLDTSNALLLQIFYTMASNFLSLFLTKTTINGILGRGGMFVFSSLQLKNFLDIDTAWDAIHKKALDLGAGDGQVTEVLSKYFNNISVTEASTVMLWRLKQRGFNTVNMDSWSTTGPYDLVSVLNLLDRHYNPYQLIRDLHIVTTKSNCLLLLTVVLPLKQYVEFHPYKKSTSPDALLVLRGHSFEEQVVSLIEDFLVPANFEVIKWGKLPYLCEGDHVQVNFLRFLFFLEFFAYEINYCI
uniref:Methyltransferase-like protein 9 n=1 Tax=Syphacia muris TaxID=451379 RepID=A0A0N5B0D0_9BILA